MRDASQLSSIGSLLTQGIFAIPSYQRDFAWSFKDVDALLSDIVSLMDSSTKQHFIGSIVVMEADDSFKAPSSQGDYGNIQNSNNDRKIYHVVDGQQRLTACSLILCALYKVLSDEPDDSFPKQSGPYSKDKLLSSIDKYLFDEDSYIGDNYAPRLFLNNGPSAQYQGCLPHGNAVNTNTYKLKNVYKQTVEAIRKQRQSSPLEASKFYSSLKNALTNQLKIDDVCCDDFGSAFQIFESINAKGQPLSSADLIKCFLIKLATNVNTQDAEVRWNKLLETVGASSDKTADLDRFIGIYLFTETGKRISKASAYDTFKKLFKNDNYLDVFDSLQTAAEIYKNLSSSNSNNRWDDTEPLKTFEVLEITSIYVPLLAAARFYPNGEKSTEFIQLKKKLEPFAIRHNVCGGTSNKLDNPFSKMIVKIKSNKTIDEVMSELKEVTPSNDMFRTAFSELTIKDSEESVATRLLLSLERFIEATQNKSGKDIPNDYSLEHIIPKEYSEFIKEWDDSTTGDNFKEEVVRSIGNMCLISKSDNSSALNKPYSEKLAVYKNGATDNATAPINTYNLLRKVVEEYPVSFTKEAVAERAKQLADHAVICWSV